MLPEWLNFKRTPRGETRPRRTMESRIGDETDAVGGMTPGDGPNNTPAPSALSTPETQPEPPGVPATRPRRALSSSGMEQAVQGFLQTQFGPKPDAPVEPQRGELAASVTELPTRPVPRVNFDETQSATRDRFADPTGRLEKQIRYERENPAADRDGKLKTFFKEFGEGMLEGGLFRGAARGLRGAIDPSVNEKRGQQQRVGRYQRDLVGARATEKGRLDLEEQRASTRLKNEQADHWAQRPEADAEKRRVQQLKDERARIFRVLSSLKGQKLDLADPRTRQLQADADRADIPFDVESFNSSKGNLVRYPRVDPANPSRTQVVERNLVTGEEKVLGQAGWVAPRDAEGRTVAEVKADEDRDAARAGTEAHRAATLALASDRLHEQMLNGLNSRAAREFTTATRGLFERRREVEKQIQDYRKRGEAYLMNPADAQRRVAELERERDELTGQIDGVREKARGAMSAAPAPASGAGRSAAPSPAPSGKTFTEAIVRERARAAGKNEDAAVEAARKKGLIP